MVPISQSAHWLIAPGRGWQPLWDEILMSTSYHFGHLLQVSKKSLWSLILYNFFHDLIHVYSPGAGQGQTAPWEQNFDVPGDDLSTSLRLNVRSWIRYIFLVCSLVIEAIKKNFDVNRKALSLYPFVASFKEISLKSDFIQFFSWFNIGTICFFMH